MTDKLNQYLQLYRTVLREILEDVQDLSNDEGDRQTGCAGWSVKDHISHVVGLEQSLGGAPEPRNTVPDYEHVSGEFAQYMELHVEARRALPVIAIIDELTTMIPRRVTQVEAAVAQGNIEVPGPLGSSSKLSANIPIRVLDLYAHRLDINRALGRPVPTDGTVADFVMGRCFGAWAALLPRAVSDQGTLTIGTPAPHDDHQVIRFGDNRANRSTTASIAGSRDTLLKLAMGRGNLDEVLAEATISGDPGLIDTITPHLAFTP